MKLTVYNKGKKSGDITYPDRLAEVKLNEFLISQIARVQEIVKTQPRQTKDRSERAGGGAKPWRQKGTGRARHGSVRSPIWRKGGVTFGPRVDQNYTKKLNKKSKQKAVLGIINKMIADKQLIIVKELPKYKKAGEWEKFLAEMPIKDVGSMLLVTDPAEYKTAIFARNIPYLTINDLTGLNLLSLLNHRYLIISQASFKKTLERFND